MDLTGLRELLKDDVREKRDSEELQAELLLDWGWIHPVDGPVGSTCRLR